MTRSRPCPTIGRATTRLASIIAAAAVLTLSLLPMNATAANTVLGAGSVDSLDALYSTDTRPPAHFDSTTTLDDYLAYAALGNPGLRRSFYTWKAAMAHAGYAGAWMDPMLTYSRFIEQVETRVGPQNQKFGLMQAIPWPGTLGAKKSIAAEQANAAYKKYEAQKLELFHAVRSAYYDYFYLGRDIELTQENLELLSFWESVARARYEVAMSKHPDVIKAQVELGKLEDRLLTLKDKRLPAASRLRAILNLPDSVELPVPSELDVTEFSPDRDEIAAAVRANNPDLKALTHTIESRRAGTRLASKLALPQFSLGVTYIETGQALNPSLPESGKDPWAVGVNINLPIWFGKNNARKREASANLRAAELNYEDAQNKLTALVDKVLFRYSDALRKVRLYRDGLIPKAEQALNASFTAYQAGETDFLNLLDAQRQLLAFQLEFEQARANLATRHSELEVLIGGDLDHFEQTHSTEGVQ